MEAADANYLAAGDEKTGGFARALLLLAKPGIVAATILAGFAGMVVAVRGWPDPVPALACVAALASAAAGSAMLNIVFEAIPDARLKRLERRVAALEFVGRGRALLLAGGLIFVGLILSGCCLPPPTTLLLLAAIVCYTLVYTLCLKRSAWGAVPGGLPGALPVLIGGAAGGWIGLDVWILFGIMLLWQPPHFWALALEYRLDYQAAGVPALPVARGERYTKLLIFVYATALLPASLALWLFGFCSAWYAGAALALGVAFLAACYVFVVRTSRFRLAFCASILYLTALLAAVICDICLGQA
jgi:protoheme IX farnesyltransferase